MTAVGTGGGGLPFWRDKLKLVHGSTEAISEGQHGVAANTKRIPLEDVRRTIGH